jgi:hypothetical protein
VFDEFIAKEESINIKLIELFTNQVIKRRNMIIFIKGRAYIESVRRSYQDSIFRSPTGLANLSTCGSHVRLYFFWVRALSLFTGESGPEFWSSPSWFLSFAVDLSSTSNFVHRVSFPGSRNPAQPGLGPLEGIILFRSRAVAHPSWILRAGRFPLEISS